MNGSKNKKIIPPYIKVVVDNAKNFDMLQTLIDEQKQLIELKIKYQNDIKKINNVMGTISTRILKIEDVIDSIIINLRGNNNERGEDNKQP